MNPFEIFGLMVAGACVIQVLLAALLQLEARLMANEADRGDQRFEARPRAPGD